MAVNVTSLVTAAGAAPWVMQHSGWPFLSHTPYGIVAHSPGAAGWI
jgi:hypothetical protein